jgi:hypothetical protein
MKFSSIVSSLFLAVVTSSTTATAQEYSCATGEAALSMPSQTTIGVVGVGGGGGGGGSSSAPPAFSLPIADSGYTITVSSQDGAKTLEADQIRPPMDLTMNEFHTITITAADTTTEPMTGLFVRAEAADPEALFEMGSTLLIPSLACDDLDDGSNVQAMEMRTMTTNSWAVAWLWSGSSTILTIDVTISLGGFGTASTMQVYHSKYYVSFGGAQIATEESVMGRGDLMMPAAPTAAPSAAPSMPEPTAAPSVATEAPTGIIEKLQQVIIENDPDTAERLGLMDEDEATAEPETEDGGVLVAATRSPTAGPVLVAATRSPTASPTEATATGASSGMPSDMPSLVPSGMPSDMPSLVPSGMPSDMPSLAPSLTPTATTVIVSTPTPPSTTLETTTNALPQSQPGNRFGDIVNNHVGLRGKRPYVTP